MKMNITQLAIDDRPREKMMRQGAQSLSNAELLAILVGSGSHDENAVSLMQRLMNACDNDLNRLGKWDLSDFMKYKGMGPAKSLTVMAALELGRRRSNQAPTERPRIRTSRDVYDQMLGKLRDKPHEEVWVLLLNHASKLIDSVCVSQGGLTQSTVDLRTILREALLRNSTAIALVHNHPSGNTRPSADDRRLTQSLKEAAKTVGITLLDHVIVTDGAYYSFCDEGEL